MTNGTALPSLLGSPHPLAPGHLQGRRGKAYETFKAIRWARHDGQPVCPRCGCWIPTRSPPAASSSALPAITSSRSRAARSSIPQDGLHRSARPRSRIFVNAVKGISALQMSRDSIASTRRPSSLPQAARGDGNETAGFTLDGEVEIDGAYFGGHIRPENRKEDRKDRRLKEHQTGTRRVVIALRERLGRTLTFVRHFEARGC